MVQPGFGGQRLQKRIDQRDDRILDHIFVKLRLICSGRCLAVRFDKMQQCSMIIIASEHDVMRGNAILGTGYPLHLLLRKFGLIWQSVSAGSSGPMVRDGLAGCS